jgi:hypothetical protein
VNIFLIIALSSIFLLSMRKFISYISLYGFILLFSIVLNRFWNETSDYGFLPSLGLICLIIFIKEHFIPIIKHKRINLFDGIIKSILKNFFFYFILLTGMVLTSMYFDKFIKISDENGYFVGLIIWIILICIIEFIIPYRGSKNKKLINIK